ncbi:hypothetical protein GGI21_005349, partial [Coemansia aciculifera]
MSEDSDQGTEDGAAVTDLQQVLEKFESFLAGDSGLEGAEILNHSDYDDDAEGSDEDVEWDANG